MSTRCRSFTRTGWRPSGCPRRSRSVLPHRSACSGALTLSLFNSTSTCYSPTRTSSRSTATSSRPKRTRFPSSLRLASSRSAQIRCKARSSPPPSPRSRCHVNRLYSQVLLGLPRLLHPACLPLHTLILLHLLQDIDSRLQRLPPCHDRKADQRTDCMACECSNDGRDGPFLRTRMAQRRPKV